MDESLRQLPQLFNLADEFDSTLKAGFAVAIVPGCINIAGVFLLDWGLYQAILISNLGLPRAWPSPCSSLRRRADDAAPPPGATADDGGAAPPGGPPSAGAG